MSPLTVHLRMDHNFFLSRLYFQTTRALVVVVLFHFFLSLHLQECGSEKGVSLCFKHEQQGYRLNGSFLAREDALSSHHTGLLEKDENYDYYVLLQPNRPDMCNCLTCDDSNFCLKENCSCTVGQEKKRQCTDIDECSRGNHTCDPNATCTNTEGSYKCKCESGYTGDEHNCTDINECFIGNHKCDLNAKCTNTEGSYHCQCNSGYAGDGHNCTDIDECSRGNHTCDPNATCTNNEGLYHCHCNTGYTGNGHTCTDIDECSKGNHTCDPNATCTNNEGSYQCKCESGYTGDGHNCTGIDECSRGNHTCDPNATCKNTEGSYHCQCNSGYSGDGHNCTDIDECSRGNHSCDPNATCTNTEGSYHCQCNNGYSGDGHNCTGIVEIGHDSESRIFVKGYSQSPGSYQRMINYEISMEQIAAIIKQSKHCEQFIKYECYANMFLSRSYAWWVSRQGTRMNYWGGAAVDSGKCACGMTNNCANGKNCNCDNNDATWREDSGYLTDKNTLPVTELRFGDVDGSKYGSDYESAYHTLGKLRCWG